MIEPIRNADWSASDKHSNYPHSPASYFKTAKKGRVEQGLNADLVILDGDPIADVRNLARVATTIRAGQVIYQTP